jgi:Putative peptidoglycan-binding domain-containing protein
MMQKIETSVFSIAQLGLKLGSLLATVLICFLAIGPALPASAAPLASTLLVQQDLAGLSYLPMSGVDGIAGPNTAAATSHFQSDNGLAVDGIAGSQTVAALTAKVQEVQRTAGTTADGDYGPGTIAAVKTYQSHHNLEVDGIAGPLTMSAMNILRKVGSTSGATSETLLIQRDLVGLGYLNTNGVDGIYGPMTRDAVLSFQSDNGLSADGIAGPITTSALTAKVQLVQRAAGTTADGDYGPNTTTAVRNYQSSHGLIVDGIAGPQTMAAMHIAREVGGGSGGGASGGTPTPPVLSGTVTQKIVQAAQSQVGIHEWGDNCNPYGPCEAWCALFASWTWRQAGINFSTAFSGDFYYYGQNHGTLHSGLSNPRPGDAIVFGTGPQSVSTSVHVGIIEQVLSNGQVVSIEGNYSNQVSRVGPYYPSARGAYAIVSPQ